MQRYAIVKDGVVLNAVEYLEQPIGTPPAFEEGSVAIPELWATVGWTYANGQFTDPNPPAIIDMPAPKSLTEVILADPAELAKLKQALGIA